jgi:hypothetical protein
MPNGRNLIPPPNTTTPHIAPARINSLGMQLGTEGVAPPFDRSMRLMPAPIGCDHAFDSFSSISAHPTKAVGRRACSGITATILEDRLPYPKNRQSHEARQGGPTPNRSSIIAQCANSRHGRAERADYCCGMKHDPLVVRVHTHANMIPERRGGEGGKQATCDQIQNAARIGLVGITDLLGGIFVVDFGASRRSMRGSRD